MDTKLVLKLAGIAGSVVLLSACATTDGPDVVAGDGAATGAGAGPSGPVPGSQEDLEQNAGHRVFFGYNQYTLTPQAQATLARQAAWMKEYPDTRLLVAGNCDERGTREYNLALGARRAEAARSYLASLGVDGSRITTVSYGKERPIDPRSTEDAWSVNRNATTTITSGAGS
ncbi:MAG: peptidoglycan-associated lipoprotein Pal [Pseudomonadota bacterium]